jgi:O-antigen ligase
VSLGRQQWIEFGGYIVALVLPLAFNPSATLPFEPVKVMLFQVITAGMGFVFIFSLIFPHNLQSGTRLQKLKNQIILNEWRADNPLLFPALIYIAVYILASLTSIDSSLSFWGLSTRQGSITVLSTVLFFLLIASALRSIAQVDRLITALLVGSVPVTIYGWVQYFGLDPLDWATQSLSPVHSTVGYSLFLGAYLVMVIPFTLSRILGGQKDGQKRPLPYLLILTLQIMCLLFTLARGAWLGLIGGCLIFLWLLASQEKRRRFLVSSALVLIAGSSLFYSMNQGLVIPQPGNPDGISNLQVAQTRAVSNNERMVLWKYTLPMIQERLLLGYGPETYANAFWQYYSKPSYPDLAEISPWDPHNIILSHLISTGLLGLLAFLWLIIRFYKITLTAFQHATDRRFKTIIAAILGSITGFFIQAQFNPYSIVPLVIFWMVMALGVSLYSLSASRL